MKTTPLPNCESCALPAVKRHGILVGREGIVWVCPKCRPMVLSELKKAGDP